MNEEKVVFALNVCLNPRTIPNLPHRPNYSNVDVAQGIAYLGGQKEERGMSNRYLLLCLGIAICFVAILGVRASVWAGLLGSDKDSWKEEVLLHDGSKMV